MLHAACGMLYVVCCLFYLCPLSVVKKVVQALVTFLELKQILYDLYTYI